MTDAATTQPVVAPQPTASARRRIPISLTLSVIWVALVLFGAVFAWALPIAGYDEPVAPGATPPFQSWPEFLGTDSIGRSQLSRIIYGAQLSLAVAVIGTLIGLIVGALLGMAAAHFRGWVATVVNLLSDSILAFPGLVLLLAIGSVVSPNVWTLSLMLGLLSVPTSLRLAYANSRAQLSRDYVLAARALGVPAWRLLTRDVFPNIMHSLFAFGFVLVATFMIALGSLDFLGVGMPPPRPSWGSMIAAGFPSIRSQFFLVAVPAVVLVLTVFAFNTIGDRLRERTDARGGQL